MTQLTSKELTMITDALTYEGLICKKARAYSRSLTDVDLADAMARIADDHERRYNELLAVIGG
ncbi:MAG: spore coat protein [Roseburia sp.]|nr:spore coat protein [Roseburia sp.]